MNKTFKFFTAAFIILIAMSACVTSHVSEEHTSETVFKAHYIRTNPIVSAGSYPNITLISSKAELEQYYNERYDTSAIPYLEQDSELKDAVNNYSENYFQDKMLVIVLLEESSGGIRHTVEKIREDGSIVISRFVPEMGTADMAEWNILIEIDRNSELEDFVLVVE